MMKTILLIDDHTPLRHNLSEILEIEGYNVLAVPDGHTGLLIAEEIRPDLIICDIMLPRMNGYEVFSQTRKNSPTAKIPFIFMSGKSNTNQGNAGENSFLSKPFDQKELIEMVKLKLEDDATHETKADYTSLDHIQALENILNLISHDLRNPICSSLGLSGLLDFKRKNNKSPEELNKIVEGIKTNAKKLNEITSAITVEIHAAIVSYKTLLENKP